MARGTSTGLDPAKRSPPEESHSCWQSDTIPMLWKGECRGNEATDHGSVQTPLSQFNSLMAFPYAVVKCIPHPPFFFFPLLFPLELTSYSFDDSKFSPAALISFTKSSFLTSTSKFYSVDLAIVIYFILFFYCIY